MYRSFSYVWKPPVFYVRIKQPVSDIRMNCNLTYARAEDIIIITNVGKEREHI